MKIAIQGHPTRGKEVIQILESLGGINRMNNSGRYPKYFYYYGDDDTIGWTGVRPQHLNVFTLEEFEKAFPFKVGDKVKHISSIGIIKEYCYVNNKPAYKVEGIELGIVVIILAKMLKPYKEMKEERNITLTLDKAKEWYKKGGELREIALQAFTEKELNPRPRSWEEFSYKYKVSDMRYAMPSKYAALWKLEQLRNCWWNGWEPDWLDGNTKKYAIKGWRDKSSIEITYVTHAFLSFPTYELALEFQECFKDLIEKAGDLI